MRNTDVSRDYDDKYTPGSSEFDLFMNQNSVLWTSGSYSKLFYVVMLLLIWGLIRISGVFSLSESWTAINVAHGVVSLYIFVTHSYFMLLSII